MARYVYGVWDGVAFDRRRGEGSGTVPALSGLDEIAPGSATKAFISDRGFLVLDAVGGGRVESGRQLFGPTSGDGFADLAAYDSDANGWIDEADPVFGRLGVWTPDAEGGGAVRGLAEAGVGALGLDRVATPFALKDGVELGAVRSSGVYLRDAGGAGTLQQVDVVV